MDLCEVLLPAFSAMIDSASENGGPAMFQRKRDKLIAVIKEVWSPRSMLSHEDIQIAKSSLRALRTLKMLSSTCIRGTSSAPNSPRRGGTEDRKSLDNLCREETCLNGDAPPSPPSDKLETSQKSEQESSLSRSSFLKWVEDGAALNASDTETLLRPLLAACHGSPLPSSTDEGKCSPNANISPLQKEAPSELRALESFKDPSAFAVLALQCFQLLVTQRLLVGVAARGSVAGKVLDAILTCYDVCVADNPVLLKRIDLESDIIQALMIVCCSPVLELHGRCLLHAFRVLLSIQRLSPSSANRCLAKSAACQVVHLTALRAEAGSAAVDPAGASTPVSLLPWASNDFPTSETVDVVQQCMSQLMGEITGVGPTSLEAAFGYSSVNSSFRHQEKELSIREVDDQRSGLALQSLSSSSARTNLESAAEGPLDPEGAQEQASMHTRCPECEERPSVEVHCLSEQGPEEGSQGSPHKSAPAAPMKSFAASCLVTCALTQTLSPLPVPVPVPGEDVRSGGGQCRPQEVNEGGNEDDFSFQGRAASDIEASRGSQWTRTGSSGSAWSVPAAGRSMSHDSAHTIEPSLHPAGEESGPCDHVATRHSAQEKRGISENLEILLGDAKQPMPPGFATGNLQALDGIFMRRTFAWSSADAAEAEHDMQQHEQGRDAVALLECLCGLIGGKARRDTRALQQASVTGRLHAMEMVLWLLDCSGPRFVQCRRVPELLLDHLCPVLLQLWTIANPATFSLCYSVLLRLIALFPRPLLPGLSLMLPHMLVRPLEEPLAVHCRATAMALHLLHCLSQQPALLLQLYANLDCRVGCGQIILRSIAGATELAAPRSSLLDSQELQQQAPRVLLDVVIGLRQWRSDACAGSRENEEVLRDVHLELLAAQQEFKEGVALFLARSVGEGLARIRRADQKCFKAHHRSTDGQLLFRYGHCLEDDAVGELLGARDSPSLTEDYLHCFDFTGQPIDEALRLLLSNFRLPGEAQKIDRIMEAFARRYWECNACVKCNAEVVEHTTRRRDAGISTLWSPGTHEGEDIRSPGEKGGSDFPAVPPTAPPGEAECIRPGSSPQRELPIPVAPFRGGAATAHVLAFSAVMLHTDAHSPAVKVKMSKADFVKNNRGIDKGQDLPESFLSALYDRVVSEEMKLHSAKEGRPPGRQLALKRQVASPRLVTRSAPIAPSYNKSRRRIPISPMSKNLALTDSPDSTGSRTSTGSTSSRGSVGARGSRLYRRLQVLTGRKHWHARDSHALHPEPVESPKGDSGQAKAEKISVRAGGAVATEATEEVLGGVLVLPKFWPPLWPPGSPLPFCQRSAPLAAPAKSPLLPEQPALVRQASVGARGDLGRASRLHGGSSLMSPRPTGLQGGILMHHNWQPGERRRWKVALASGLCSEPFFEGSHLSVCQSLFQSIAGPLASYFSAASLPLKPGAGSTKVQSPRHLKRAATPRTIRHTHVLKQSLIPVATIDAALDLARLLGQAELEGKFASQLKATQEESSQGSRSMDAIARSQVSSQTNHNTLPKRCLDYDDQCLLP